MDEHKCDHCGQEHRDMRRTRLWEMLSPAGRQMYRTVNTIVAERDLSDETKDKISEMVHEMHEVVDRDNDVLIAVVLSVLDACVEHLPEQNYEFCLLRNIFPEDNEFNAEIEKRFKLED